MRQMFIRRMGMIGLTLLAATPAMAQEHGGNFATKFLIVDNALGTALVWACLLISVAILALIVRSFLINRASVFTPPEFAAGLQRLLEEKNYRQAIDLANAEPSPFGRMMSAALNQASRGHQTMDLVLEETGEAIANRRVRDLIWLEVAGAAGPMIGLFGTIFGMILSFNQLVSLGGQPKPAQLAEGIGTALVCTFWGLIVGIPGVIAASLFRVKVEGLAADAIFRGKELLAPFRAGGGASRKPGSSSSTGAPLPPLSPKPSATSA